MLISTPCTAAEIAANYHLHGIALAPFAYRDHRVRSGFEPIGNNILSGTQKTCCNLIEDLPFVGYAMRQNHVKGGDSVGGNHHKTVGKEIDVTNLAVIDSCLLREVEIGLG